ncbi:MAG: SsrA-binding protein SmpB [Candidatus Eremiobacteraeota bacterium]|nr:SsrA-binding protein SmpB [Candidatus Eremiobacteraeota bacterium]MBV8203678.1 SsrA-binding protein SmpB [Candidatus Eremiobacteraeota bacterium]MBV8339593.1 SsrA-binding protein SmpB [Candidatus Eremiobacteraeota bacterium]MBV8460473.1 SsrA-binding protein SmpB [Candidatus Eremiobacteraeota bacterium]MBV8595290.1 SsrA-binding protein SmpB [Candidatus Eremiobacteraeota bacterium]
MTQRAAKDGQKTIASNRKAFHEYSIQDTFEAGLVLTGTEVKSLRAGGCSLVDGFVRLKGGEAWLVNVHIPAYEQGTFFSQHEPRRDRKLLLHARELQRLAGKLQEKGLALLPLRLYFRKNRAKVEVGLGRGKKLHDKREAIREREVRREIERAARRA